MVYSKDLVSVVSLVAQLVKKPPAMWETWAQSLSWEDPLEKEQLPSPVFWPGESPLCIVRGGLKELDTTKLLSLFLNKKLRNERVEVENVSKKKKNPCGPGWRCLFIWHILCSRH